MAYISNICAILDLTKKKEKFYAGIRQINQATDGSKIFEYRCIMLMRSVSQRKLYRRSE